MSNAQREFAILVNATDRSMAEVSTDDPIWIAAWRSATHRTR